MKPGDTVWYFSKDLGSGLTRQDEVKILEMRGERAKIQGKFGKSVWVKIKNLRPLT
jgi:hypothetical protein